MEDRDSLSIAMIGSDDVTADSMAMDAMEAGKLKPVYITVSGTVDAQSTAQQGVRDMAQRKADLIIIAGIDANEANAENWNDALKPQEQRAFQWCFSILSPCRKTTNCMRLP